MEACLICVLKLGGHRVKRELKIQSFLRAKKVNDRTRSFNNQTILRDKVGCFEWVANQDQVSGLMNTQGMSVLSVKVFKC
ncbi:hypothetical protein L1987_60390 [Smallanthus sonchifolius]|uniref:Uncharacterized protein n=1 Tax=Smallanthus sonchifolius TaxID=185202 RepID=A0ACB9D823_9ASTR|nr:hypothetical protein L1987_60390 [Smallanthus sonchifolius]